MVRPSMVSSVPEGKRWRHRHRYHDILAPTVLAGTKRDSARDGSATAIRISRAAPCTYRIALGFRAGHKVLTLKTVSTQTPQPTPGCCVSEHGFSLHAEGVLRRPYPSADHGDAPLPWRLPV